MLILSIVTTTLLVMMTQHRIWIIAGLGGALCAWAFLQFMRVFELILPHTWHVFNGVFAFLAVALIASWLISLYEKALAAPDDV